MSKKSGKISIPAGWDEAGLDKAAARCHDMIEEYEGSKHRAKCFKRYDFARAVFEDEKIPSNLQIIKEVDPINYPLLRKQVKGAVRMVASTFNGADPYFIFTGGGDNLVREAREKDTQLALDADRYKPKLRDSGRIAALGGRSPYRIVWAEQRAGDGWLNTDTSKDEALEFAGPQKELIEAEDFGLYPPDVQQLTDARAVWHRFDRPMWDLRDRQAAGEYFDFVDLPAQHEQDETNPVNEEDYEPDLLAGVFKFRVNMDPSKPMRAYRVTYYKAIKKIIAMKPYDLPMLEYFAPGFEYDPLQFWPSHSIGSSVLQMNAALNDAQFTRLMASIAMIKRPVLASGAIGETSKQSIGLGDIHLFRGDVKFTTVPIPGASNGDLADLAEDARVYAEGVTGFTEVAAGQMPDAEQTATATSGALQGTADEGEEKRENFLEEEVRAIKFIQILIARNFKAFKKFHGDKLSTRSASEWRMQFDIGPNGQGPNNNPEAVHGKISTLMESVANLAVPFLDEVETGAIPNVGVAIDRVELFKSIEQNLNFPMSMDKVIIDTRNLGPVVAPAPVESAGLGIGGPEELLGGGLPPELLGLIGGAPGVPPPALGIPPPVQPPGVGFDPILSNLLGMPAGV